MNQQQVNAMVGMNTAGGPVGGTPTMNNRRIPPDTTDTRKQLNTYIYEYLLKNNHYQTARLLKEEAPINFIPGSAKSNSNGRQINGADSMDTDSKGGMQGRPDDLELPKVPEFNVADNSFLLDWWCQFWDLFGAARNPPGRGPEAAHAYLNHTRAQAQMRNDQQQRIVMANSLQYQSAMMRSQMPNGMVGPNELQRKAIQNNRTPQQLSQMPNMNKQALMTSNMSRDGSGMDLGQRPQSPGSANNAPSPNKRQRLEGNGFNSQPMGGARSQGMVPQPMGATSNAGNGHQMMPTNGMNPGDMSGTQFDFAGQGNPQQKSLEGMNPGVPQGSPMGQSLEGQQDLFNSAPRMPGQNPGQPQQGNHALQDYQMQLMLLEQQNKKRLMMARQEQDNMAQGPGGHGQGVNAQGFAPNMSPSGSRAGPSPNPSDQMRKTPKMGQQGLPGSPMGGDLQNRNSPGPNGFDPNQMPPGMPPQYYPGMQNNTMMRPPSSHPFPNGQFTPQQMEAIARNNGRMPNGQGNWPQGPQQLMPNQGQQPGPMGTPVQRNSAMPPPPAPPNGGEPARTQPSSPAQPAPPPTPTQTTKANPRKKDTKDNKKKPTKKNTTNSGNPPASEGDPPPTPTPSTPITPMNANSFNPNPTQKGNAQQPAAAPAPVQQPPMDTNPPFGVGLGDDQGLSGFDFPPVDGSDVLENFDFDSFLHTGDNEGFGGLGGDLDFAFNGVEAGTGDL